MLAPLLGDLRVQRVGSGRPRTRPDAVLGDKAYSSRANRSLLRRRGIRAVIPEPSDQQGHRQRRGSAGGRPVHHDRELYKRRNTVERFFNRCKEWRGLAMRTDKYARTYRGALLLRAVTLWLKRDTP